MKRRTKLVIFTGALCVIGLGLGLGIGFGMKGPKDSVTAGDTPVTADGNAKCGDTLCDQPYSNETLRQYYYHVAEGPFSVTYSKPSFPSQSPVTVLELAYAICTLVGCDYRATAVLPTASATDAVSATEAAYVVAFFTEVQTTSDAFLVNFQSRVRNAAPNVTAALQASLSPVHSITLGVLHVLFAQFIGQCASSDALLYSHGQAYLDVSGYYWPKNTHKCTGTYGCIKCADNSSIPIGGGEL